MSPVVRLSSSGHNRGVVLFLHGGAYVMGSARQALTAAHLVRDGGPAVISVEYRLAPEHPHPAAVDDALSVYQHLVSSQPSRQIIVVGESAGGGLAMLMLQRARDEGLPMPRLAVVAFPWVDLTVTGSSTTTNRGKDLLTRSELRHEASLFAPGQEQSDPAVSPLFGSFHHLPPTYLAVGTHDLLLDDARRLALAMRRDGTEVRLEEWPEAVHGFTALPVRERHLYQQRLRRLIDSALSPPPGDASQFARDTSDPEPVHDLQERSMPPTPAETTLPVSRGRHRFAAIGYAVRVVKALPAPMRERILDGASGGVSSNLPPFEDLHRLVESAGGIPNGRRWQAQLLARRPHLRDVVVSDVSDDTDGRLRARLYRLPGPNQPTAALVWVHGGAFLIGSLDQEEAHWPAIELAAAGIPVLSVDYRPCINGVHYPAPQDDVLTAWRWAVDNSDRLGVAPDQLHLGGGSAGGCLVAGATLRLRASGEQMPSSLYLAYPVLGRELPPATPDIEADLAGLSLVDDAWFQAMFDNWAGTADPHDPYVAPGSADLQDLPPTYVLTCGHDTLRRASEPFARRLQQSGTTTWHEVLPESQHAPLDRPETPDGDLALERLRAWIRGGVNAMLDPV